MIYRGTTPAIAVDVDGIDLTGWAVWVSLRSGGVSLDLTGDRVATVKTDTGCTVTAALTQEETLSLRGASLVRIQVRAVSELGEAIATTVATEAVGDVLMGGVISHG